MQEKIQKFSPIKERILQFAASTGVSKREFYARIGVSRGTLESKTGITEDVLAKFIATYPEVSINWLITGLDDPGPSTPENSLPSGIEKPIPLIPLEAFAGYSPAQFSDIPTDYYHITEFDQADFLVRVKGDSMTPRFNGGDIVACKKVHEMLFFQWHRIYVICTKSQGVMIKRVEKSEKEHYIKLVSDNALYDPFDIPEEDISDIALVMGTISLE